ncbi:MAG TPA: polyprenyl synthetase family protein [Gaiellaceae bacterium]|nr:polyprenyl synthetase family protein [Gaiellaceae bacterium]
MTALAAVKATPGLDAYMAALEDRLRETVASHPGTVADAGAQALDAGGKRLRPLLVFLASPAAHDPLPAGVAVELVHMASLVHDDLIDRAALRRGRETAWRTHGSVGARATGDYLFARAFSELAATGDAEGVQLLADAALALVRGEALQHAQAHEPDTTEKEYLRRCTLKTAELFRAACLLGSRDEALGRFGLALGIAFQITDDILDCTGTTIETGKLAGNDLREGTPTLPLILAAREDPVVHAALAGGPLDGALIRVAQTGALERARDVALRYAAEARRHLEGRGYRPELEALTHIVVERRN